MKLPPTKAQIRNEIEQKMQDFLNRGGKVLNVEQGVSGRVEGASFRPSFAQENRGTRTSVADVVATIEARKKNKAPPLQSKRRKQPQKKMLFDDFGEPLRWVWVEQ